jgi:hypothetical protein
MFFEGVWKKMNPAAVAVEAQVTRAPSSATATKGRRTMPVVM